MMRTTIAPMMIASTTGVYLDSPGERVSRIAPIVLDMVLNIDIGGLFRTHLVDYVKGCGQLAKSVLTVYVLFVIMPLSVIERQMQNRIRIPITRTISRVAVEHLKEMAGVFKGIQGAESRLLEQLIEQKYEIYKELDTASKGKK